MPPAERARRWTSARALACSLACAASGCNALAGTQDLHVREDTSVDDVADVGDALDETDADLTNYHDFTDPKNWDLYDFSTSGGLKYSFSGAAFDGRYVYAVPASAGAGIAIQRYDTTLAFGKTTSWSKFTPSKIGGDLPQTLTGAAFDGRYLYLVPACNGGFFSPAPCTGASLGNVLRFDTTADTSTSFASSTPFWKTFDATTAVGKTVPDLSGAVFDGRYLYFVPMNGDTTYGVVLRLDTQGPFDAASSYATFDATTLDKEAGHFIGATFDGRYVYFAPRVAVVDSSPAPKGVPPTGHVVLRLDTTATFTDKTSWATFDLNALGDKALARAGAAFDGRYVYLGPASDLSPLGSGARSTVVRYDTSVAFGVASAWSTFDLSSVAPAGADYLPVFDGRHVYFLPSGNAGPGGTAGTYFRHDTWASFSSASSWSSFSGSGATSMCAGGVFDGRYVYCVPRGNLMVRFDAKDPPSLPKYWHASFQ